MRQGAHAAPEEGVDVVPQAFPGEVLVVQRVVLVQLVQVVGQVLGRVEVVHVDEGVGRGGTAVVLGGAAHGDGDDVVSGEVKKASL